MTEKQWQAIVLDLAHLYGWRVYHTFDSRRSEPGFPDLILVREETLLAVELKTDAGRTTPVQDEWLRRFARVRTNRAAVWRPRDVDRVAVNLRDL